MPCSGRDLVVNQPRQMNQHLLIPVAAPLVITTTPGCSSQRGSARGLLSLHGWASSCRFGAQLPLPHHHGITNHRIIFVVKGFQDHQSNP